MSNSNPSAFNSPLDGNCFVVSLTRSSLFGFFLTLSLACGSTSKLPTAQNDRKLQTEVSEKEAFSKQTTRRFCDREVAANQLLIKFHEENLLKSAKDIENLTTTIAGEPVVAEPLGDNVMLIQWNSNRSVEEIKERFASKTHSEIIEYVEPDYAVPLDCAQPGHGSNTHLSKQWGLDNISACSAWTVATGEDIVVAVIDSGISCEYKASDLLCHEDLQNNLWLPPPGFSVRIEGKDVTCPGNCFGFDAMARDSDDDAKKWSPIDNSGHGTQVSGIIAASDNNTGIVGVSFKSKILVIRYASQGAGFVSSIKRAINFIIAAREKQIPNLRVVNCSFGFDPKDSDECDSQTLRDSFEKLAQKDILVVASNGNHDELTTTARLHYPSQYGFNNIIAVSPTTKSDDHFPSTYNPTSVNLIGAPGEGIYTTVGDDYGLAGGGSFAAPFVTAAAALVMSHRKVGCDKLTAANLRTTLLKTADQMPKLKPYIMDGRRLNAFRAVTKCKEYLK